MKITSLQLRNFRNFASCSFQLSEGVTIFLGENAQGKTNLLEAVSFLSTTRSHRVQDESLCIRSSFGSANLEVQIEEDGSRFTLAAVLHKEGKTLLYQNQPVSRTSEFIGKLNAVLFSPSDMDLFETSPRYRRKMMDVEMGKISVSYMNHLNRYLKVLKERNAYLKQKSIEDSYLEVLTSQCIEAQLEIIRMRKKFVDEINDYLQDYYRQISLSENKVIALYVGPVETDGDVRQSLIEKYEKSRERDLVFKLTHVGVHRDDITFLMDVQPVIETASQGQKRILILAIKCSLVKLIEKNTHRQPVLLLDDVLSELDAKRRTALFETLDPSLQTLITTTDIQDVEKWIKAKAKVFYVENGKVTFRKEEVR